MFMKSVMVVSGLVALLGLATYPTIFYPRAHPEYYRKPCPLAKYGSIDLCIFITFQVKNRKLSEIKFHWRNHNLEVLVFNKVHVPLNFFVLAHDAGMKVWSDPFDRDKKTTKP